MELEAFPENTDAGRAFQNGWDTFVKVQHLPDTFWDPVDHRWENYPRAKFTLTRVGLPQIPLGTDYWSERTILHEVINIGATTRALDGRLVWDPRDGYWYHWSETVAAPPPPPGVPPWLQELNAELDALARNTHLTPEERYQARMTVLERAYGAH